jgi:hypothetical protein
VFVWIGAAFALPITFLPILYYSAKRAELSRRKGTRQAIRALFSKQISRDLSLKASPFPAPIRIF